MWQEGIVGLVVVAAALYAVRGWLPETWRERLGLKSASGCGACKACGGASCRPTQDTASAAQGTPLRWEPPSR